MPLEALFVFGDQAIDLSSAVENLNSCSLECDDLQRFIHDALKTLRRLTLKLPIQDRPHCDSFDTLPQFASAIKPSNEFTSLNAALLTIVQLGALVWYAFSPHQNRAFAEDYRHLAGDPRAIEINSTTSFFGLCTGSIAAAVAASCHNLYELLSAASEAVELAFQVGLIAAKRSKHVEHSNSAWAIVVPSLPVAKIGEALASFNKAHNKRYGAEAYISAVNMASTTISGPPSTLEEVFTNITLLRDSKRTDLPIRTLFHADHLDWPLPLTLVEDVCVKSFDKLLEHRLISPASGKPYSTESLGMTLRQVVCEILHQPIRLDLAAQSLAVLLDHHLTIHAIGPTMVCRSLEASLSDHKVTCAPICPPVRAQAPSANKDAIAVVGMSARLPGSDSVADFWRVLESGRDLHTEIPPDRFDSKSHYDPTGKKRNTTLTPYGVFIDGPGWFDPRFFNISPREAFQTDPQQRLMLLTTYEALENAGYAPNRTSSTETRRIASFIGQTSDDYREVNSGQDIDTYFITGGIRAFGPGRINYHFGWEGPSMSLDTACSSSAVSIQLACSALLAKDVDMAVAGGANLLTSSDLFAGLSRGGFLSKSGGCKTFDQSADGYVRADACGVIVLKRLEDAIADRDDIQAVIRGASTNHSAEAPSITHPHDETQQRLFRTVLDKAGVLPHEIDYAEMHGTGTQAGDYVECRSVTTVLCQNRSLSNPLYIGSVKPNVGHGEAASGVTSIIKAILMMKHNTIPPHVGIKTSLNKKLPPLNGLNVHIADKVVRFRPRVDGDGKRRVLVNNFDAAGGNTSLMLEDPPQLTVHGHDPRGYQVVSLSAKSITAIAKNARKLLQHLRENSEIRLEDLAYTTTARRIHHHIRKAYAVANTGDLCERLEDWSSSALRNTTRKTVSPDVVFCFTGQGSQHVTMTSRLYQTLPCFRDLINQYDAICIRLGFSSFLPVIHGPKDVSISPVHMQLALIAIELALCMMWRSFGVNPNAVIGHSIGEYAALCCAGVISVNDCFYLIGSRASLMIAMSEPGTHAMLAVSGSAEKIQKLLSVDNFCGCEIACLNATNSVSFSGSISQIEILHLQLQSEGLTTKIMNVPFAFHSSQLDGIIERYQELASLVLFNKPTIPVASSLLGEVITSQDVFNASYLSRQARLPVRFAAAVSALENTMNVNERTVFLEIGPHPICLSMIRSTIACVSILVPTLKRGRDDWAQIDSSIALLYEASIDIDWQEYHRPFENSLKLLPLPNYCFDLQDYWIPYEGHWNLSKIDAAGSSRADKHPQPTPFSATTLQRIESEEITDEQITVKFTSDTSEPVLNEALKGHIVNQAMLCPSSIYADMAFCAAKYVYGRADVQTRDTLEVCEMIVHKPLLTKSKSTGQVIRVTAVMTMSSKEIRIRFESQERSSVVDHARCVVRIGRSQEWQRAWARYDHLIHQRMKQLTEEARNGHAHMLRRSMAYNLFGSFVQYSTKYQGMDEVYLDSKHNEAYANITFKPAIGNFTYNPYWIDSVAHLSGFVLNCSDAMPTDCVFISHGWGSMKFSKALDIDKEYRTYVRMQPTEFQHVFSGDVYLFEGEKIVGVVEDLKFQQIKRSILAYLLPPAIDGFSSVRTQSSRSQPEKLNTRTVGGSQEHGSGGVMTPASQESDFDVILAIIAAETKISINELNDDSEFAHLGVDSLLTMRILEKLHDQLQISPSPYLMAETPTIGHLRAWYTSRDSQKPATGSAIPGFKHSSPIGSGHQGCDPTASDECLLPTPLSEGEAPVTVPERPEVVVAMSDIIAKETRIAIEEIEMDAPLSDLGVDSLLSLQILARIKDELSVTLPLTFFLDHRTLTEVQHALGRLCMRGR